MPSDGAGPVLADPPGWRMGARLSFRNSVCVHRASAPDGRAAVVKRLDAGAADPIAALRFTREQRLASILRHPGLATCLGNGEGWLAFETLDGPRGGPLASGVDRANGLAVLRSLALTLAYLHGRGVVHQDVKPAHVFQEASGRVVLIDLGTAGLMSDDPLAGHEAVGAPAWAAPEQLDGAPPAPAADLWSLARLALWLLGETEPAALAEPLATLVTRCLSIDPSVRPSAAAFHAALKSPVAFDMGFRSL